VSSRNGLVEDAAVSANPAEQAFKAVIAAIRRKDSAALAKLADPTQGEGTKDFDDQSVAFSNSFDALKMVACLEPTRSMGCWFSSRSWRPARNLSSRPCVCAQGRWIVSFPAGTVKATRPSDLADWFNPNLGSPGASEPPYCDDKDIKRATHRVPLAPVDAGNAAWHPSRLLLAGAPFEAPEALAILRRGFYARIESVKSADFSAGADDFLKLVNSRRWRADKKWLAHRHRRRACQNIRDRWFNRWSTLSS